jgi:hypothetical protein
VTAPSFGLGARGFVVARLQELLGINPDGHFGPVTADAVISVQQKIGAHATGEADAQVFGAYRKAFPTEFEICMNLTNAFEGTGFGGVNERDIDGAGVTMGIAGFTTKHGEIQKLLTEFHRRSPRAIMAPLPRWRAQRLAEILEEQPPRSQWEDYFYGGDGRLDKEIKAAVNAWGKELTMRRLQLDMAQKRFWIPALASANRVGLKSMAGRGLMLDVHVQNGGWRDDHHAYYKSLLPQGQVPSEKQKLATVAVAVSQLANPKWYDDVRSRKIVYAQGYGEVHGSRYELDAQAFN